MKIAGRRIGPGEPPYLIAEVSCNHGGKLATALRMIDAAKAAGADAVKFQAYTADTITLDCEGPDFMIKDGPWQGWRLYDLYKQCETPFEWFPKLFERARAAGVACFASVFDRTAVDLMVRLGAPAIKIASFEIVDTPLIKYAAATGKPLIISTGMATMSEIEAAAAAVGQHDRMFLNCVSGYPATAEDYDLTSANWDSRPWGISDHTLGIELPVAATALGCSMIEKHFTLGRHRKTADAEFSTEPDEFAAMAAAVRRTWRAVDPGNQSGIMPASEQLHRPLRRSLYAVADIKKGEILTDANVRSIRPGYGLPPNDIESVLNRHAAVDIARGARIEWAAIAPR